MLKETRLENANPLFRKFLTCLEELSLKEIKIIEYYFTDGLTLEEIGKMYGLTNERVRQVIANAERKVVLKMK